MNTYTVVYKLGNQYWLVQYQHGLSQNIVSSDCMNAILWGTEVARWGDD